MIYLFTEKFGSTARNTGLNASKKSRMSYDNDSFAHSVSFGTSTINLSVNKDMFSPSSEAKTSRDKNKNVANYLKNLNVFGKHRTFKKMNQNASENENRDLVYYALTRV